PITATIAVSDTAGNTASGTGDTSTKDTTADAAPTASIAINDGEDRKNVAEGNGVSHTVGGIDGDASATVTFSDGVNPDGIVTSLGNGAHSGDLGSPTDGPITATIAVSDTAGNTASGTGDTSTKDTTADAAPTASIAINDG